MTEMQKIYLLIPMLPLLAAIIVGLFGRKLPRASAHWLTIAGVAASFGLSAYVFADVLRGHTFNGAVYTWLTSGATSFEIGFLIDKIGRASCRERV